MGTHMSAAALVVTHDKPRMLMHRLGNDGNGISVSAAQMCATLCGMTGLLVEDQRRWETAAHIMIASCL